MTRDQLYAEVSELCVKRGVEKFIGVGPDLMAEADRIGVGEKYFFPDSQTFIKSPVFSLNLEEK